MAVIPKREREETRRKKKEEKREIEIEREKPWLTLKKLIRRKNSFFSIAHRRCPQQSTQKYFLFGLV